MSNLSIPQEDRQGQRSVPIYDNNVEELLRNILIELRMVREYLTVIAGNDITKEEIIREMENDY